MKAPRVAAAVLVCLASAGVAGVASAAPQETDTRLYPLQYVSLTSASSLARSVCQREWEENRVCNPDIMERENTVVLTATAEAHGRFTLLLESADVPPHTQAFHIIVLEATRGQAGISGRLPDEARAALEDAQQFLPFESFRVIDTGWVRTSRSAQTNLTGQSSFRVQLQFRGSPDTGRPLMIDHFEIFTQEWMEQMVEGQPSTTYTEREIIETSFGIDVGETVVVGTSKLDGGDNALVVLVTAVR